MPESDQEDVGTALLDTSDDVVVVHVVERRPRRFVHPGYHEARIRRGEVFGGGGRVAVLAAEEEDAGVDVGRRRSQPGNQVRSGDPARESRSQQPAQPDDRGAVGQVELAAVEHRTRRRVASGVDQEVEIDRADLGECAGGDGLHGAVHRLIEVDGIDRHPAQLGSLALLLGPQLCHFTLRCERRRHRVFPERARHQTGRCSFDRILSGPWCAPR